MAPARRQYAPAQPAGRAALAWFNGLAQDAAVAELLACCSCQHWAERVAAGRPYPSAEAALRVSDAAVASLTEADLAEALAGHPRIGDRAMFASGRYGHGAGSGQARAGAGSGRAGGGSAGVSASRREQSAVAGSGDAVLRELANGNAAYEQRFGHIYLACATGRGGAELLEFLRQRLGNSRETEWLVVGSELAKINQIRLRSLLAGQP